MKGNKITVKNLIFKNINDISAKNSQKDLLSPSKASLWKPYPPAIYCMVFTHVVFPLFSSFVIFFFFH